MGLPPHQNLKRVGGRAFGQEDGGFAGGRVVSGSKPLIRGGRPVESGVHLYCPVIIKYRDAKASGSVRLEDLLR